MCGITGFWRRRPLDDDDETRLRAMVEAIEHRGPDGRHVWLDREHGLGMGHARLSVIDLQTGDQPIFGRGAGGLRVLTANGELYDYKSIRTRLVCDGAEFSTKTDTEIALHLFARHGLDFVHQLRGEFAIALYDGVEDRLILVRDRFGIKPLYMFAAQQMFAWGSEIKAILAHPAVPARLDAKAVLHQLMHTMVPGTTAFTDVKALMPGHMAIITRRAGGFSIETIRYWDAEFPDAAEHATPTDPAVHVEGVRERLMDAVRVRLEADVPVGCYLSGGIDSCSILGLASAMQQSHVKAFTISFDHDAYDESKIAADMAAKTRADHVVMKLGADALYGDYYPRVVWHAERTFYNTLGVAKWHMSRRVHECGYKVVVTGEGSDELFGGYPFFKRDMLLHAGSSAEREAFLRQIEHSNRMFKGAILAEAVTEHPALNDVVGFTPAWIQPWILTLAQVRPLLSSTLREQLADYDPIEAIAAAFDPAMLRGRHPLDRAQYTWIKTMLEGQILTWGGDRVDMANSMESRPAFLDHHLAEFAFRIPPRLRIRDNREKWVLREAMRGVLPKRLYEREKFAFMAPPSHTDANKRRAVELIIERHLSRDAITRAGLFDPTQIDAFLARLRGNEDHSTGARLDIILNHVLGLQLLHHQYVAGAGRPAV